MDHSSLESGRLKWWSWRLCEVCLFLCLLQSQTGLSPSWYCPGSRSDNFYVKVKWLSLLRVHIPNFSTCNFSFLTLFCEDESNEKKELGLIDGQQRRSRGSMKECEDDKYLG